MAVGGVRVRVVVGSVMRPRETPVYKLSEYEVPGMHADPTASPPGPVAQPRGRVKWIRTSGCSAS